MLPVFFPKYNNAGDNSVGVCTLLCHKHVTMFIWSTTAFFYFLGKSLPIYIVDDGSLTTKDIVKLRKYFKVFIDKQKIHQAKIERAVKKYKYIKKFRFDEKVLMYKKKLDVFILCPFKKFIFLDADVLFIKKPKILIDWLKIDKGFNWYTAHHPYESKMYGYFDSIGLWSFRRLLYKTLKNSLSPYFNSGILAVADSKSISLRSMNRVLNLLDEVEYFNHFRVEEAITVYAYNQEKCRLLPTLEYVNVSGDEEYRANVSPNSVSVHYSGEIKNFRYKTDALKLALRTRLFRLR